MMIPISVIAGVDQRLDPVEEHGFVGDRHQLLGRGVGDRAQAGAGAAGENQSLQGSMRGWNPTYCEKEP